ncbi:DUF6227 family protein [Streptomyces sp. INA 01156]
MSVPYETAAYEPADSPESPEEHLARLLGRALNSFELPDEAVHRLDCALAHDSSLHSAHHSACLHRETYRHTWLLADGSALTLWELVHNATPAASRARGVRGRGGTAGRDRPVAAAAGGPGLRAAGDGAAVPDPHTPPGLRPDGSADHARRLLRRAENADRPGPGTAALLTTASAHQITQAFGRPSRAGRAGRSGLSFSLYEHAFLLRDGVEMSLWEVEHTATPDGRHMCEVYVTEDAARDAMERRAAQVS